jgi:hypothetical protein
VQQVFFENSTTSFSVYPNPASNNITIKNLAQADALTLVDISGKGDFFCFTFKLNFRNGCYPI